MSESSNCERCGKTIYRYNYVIANNLSRDLMLCHNDWLFSLKDTSKRRSVKLCLPCANYWEKNVYAVKFFGRTTSSDEVCKELLKFIKNNTKKFVFR